MKVVLTYPFLSGQGGMETVIKKVLLNIPSQIQLDFLLPGGSKDNTWAKNISRNNVKLVFHNYKNSGMILYDTYRYLLREKPDVVITMNNLQIIPILAARPFVKNMKILSWNHFSLKYTKANFLLKKCDLVLAISSGAVRELNELGVDSQKIRLVYNPIDKVSEKYFIPKNCHKKKHFIYVGRIQYKKQKNLSEMFKILSKLKLDYQLDIYGDGSQEDKSKLTSLSNELGINSNIVWHGWSDNIWGKVKDADIMLFTSKYEGFALSIAEAISHGIPVISSNCPNGPEDIVNSVNGRLYTPGNIGEAVELINSFCAGDLEFGTQEEISKSIEKFYTPNYIKNFLAVLNEENKK